MLRDAGCTPDDGSYDNILKSKNIRDEASIVPLSKETTKGGILMEKGMVSAGPPIRRYAKSQEILDEVIKRQLPLIHLSGEPVYNARIKANGMVYVDRVLGNVTKFYIGRQDRDSEEFLLDSILHEELEARVAFRAIRLKADKFQKMLGKDKPTHAYINSVIARYFRMRGWKWKPQLGKM